MLLLIGACLIVGVFVIALAYHFKDSEKLDTLKNKLFWNSILKSLVQTYFPVSVNILSQINKTKSIEEFINLPKMTIVNIILKLSIIIALPIFSVIFLKRN